MAREYVVRRSGVVRQLAFLATVFFIGSWLLTAALFVHEMGRRGRTWDHYTEAWTQLSTRKKFPTIRQVAALDLVATMLWPFAMAARAFEKQRVRKESMMGFCPQCGYDLFANSSQICPECGTSVNVYPAIQ